MSGMEIERKFLVKQASDFRKCSVRKYHIQQGYIPAKNATVRIRKRDTEAFLTIKSHVVGKFSRYEFEKEITADEAQHLLRLCVEPLIDKTRYIVPVGEHIFEVDEFHGENEGLIVAEIELSSEDEMFTIPDFIEKEVTADPRYRNSYLVQHPYRSW